MPEVRRLGPADLRVMRAAMSLFAEAFDDGDSYLGNPPTDRYLANRLADPSFIMLTAWLEGTLAGALAGYELAKFERERSEIYIYDLAVAEPFRRQGVATGLIEALRPIACACGAWVIYVQADLTDPPAIALYEKLGTREEVLHFDIAP